MGSLKHREERRKTFVHARLRTDQGWSDVTIGNVSSRGLMLQGAAQLRRNEFIELHTQRVSVVGRVVWVCGARCGVRTQDAVDVPALLARGPQKRPRPGEERRRAARDSRPVRRPSAAETAEASRRFARAFDWTVVVVAAGTAGALMAQAVWGVLDTPLAQAGAALAGNG